MNNNKIDFLEKIYYSQINNIKKENFNFTLIISISSICNLNCTNCQAFCKIEEYNDYINNNSNKYFTSLKDLKYSIPIIKKEMGKCNNIILWGGEPLLNPELKEICKYLRKEFNEIPIEIFTNGILLNSWEEENYSLIKKLNIGFIITLYPIEKNINNIKNQENKMKKLNIPVKIHGTRPYFSKNSYNKKGIKNYKERYFYCMHSNFPPTFYLYKNKIFKCGVQPRFEDLNIPLQPSNYLKIQDLNFNNLIDFCKKPLLGCSYCGNNLNFSSDEIFFWNTQKQLSSNYFDSLLDLYLNNYELYYQYCHQCKHIIPLLKNKYFLSKYINEGYPSDPFKIYMNRFFNGFCDIYIPFSKNNFINIKKNKEYLLKQNQFEKINFYFISIDKDKKIKKNMYKLFPPTSDENKKGNFYFLESENFKQGYENFLTNSYLEKKIILNFFDESLSFNLKNKDYLYKSVKGENNEPTI